MNSLPSSLLGPLFITIAALASGCGGGADSESQDDLSEAASDASIEFLHGDVEVRLERVGHPSWKPVDFHHFSAPWDELPELMVQILPPPNHEWHPDLAIGPGAPHQGPYTDELEDSLEELGYVDRSTFTKAQFMEGVVLAWMNVPRKSFGTPKGSSPDFNKGPIIPNSLFPIHIEIRYSRDGVVDTFVTEVDVPALDQSLSPPFNVQGHSHFPMFNTDSGEFYGAGDLAGKYRWLIEMRDAEGEGWDIDVPYKVK